MSNKSKHTPGPWKAEIPSGEPRSGVRYASIVPENSLGPVVAYTPSTLITKDQLKANARLIAAAPELLEACKFIERFLREKFNTEDTSKYLSQLKTAIAKAEGGDDV